MLLRIALRNIWLHRLRTLIVGGIMAFGTMLLIVGNGLVDAIEGGMERSIVHSVAGHIQVFSADAEDELHLFGRPGMVEAKMDKIDNFRRVKEALLELDNVSSVVPMGLSYAIVFGGNAIDLKCAQLRDQLREGQGIAAKDRAHLRQMVMVLKRNLKKVSEIAQLNEDDLERAKGLEKATKDAFWERFEAAPEESLELIENDVAPLGARADMFFLFFIGTDLQAFEENFELFKIVEGRIPPAEPDETNPTGPPLFQRGFLLNKRFYDRHMKNRIAYNLDTVKMLRDDEEQLIADESDLREKLAQNVRQVGSLMMDFDPEEAEEVRKLLVGELGTEGDELEDLLKTFLDMNDENFDRRVAFFYEKIVPFIRLYRYKVGDTIDITSMTRARSAKSVKLKIWGIYQFRSLEKSQLAGQHHLMDLVTFRELYGFPTQKEKDEMDALIASQEEADKDEAKLATADLEEREADLFGGAEGGLIEKEGSSRFDEFSRTDLKATRRELAEEQSRRYTKDQLEEGIALNAAILLKDPTKLEETMKKIQALSDARGLNLQVASWHEASGIIGNFTSVIRLVLNVMILIIFIVALVIMNNALVMATMERVREVGTIRAMGAQRSFIMGMFLGESLMMTLIFGTLGALGGVGVMMWLESAGIPAFHKILFFLFGGPSLHPTVTLSHVVTAATTCGAVALISTLYPAWLATRIQPVTAMQTHD